MFESDNIIETLGNNFLGPETDVLELQDKVLFPELNEYRGDFVPPRCNIQTMIGLVKKAMLNAFIISFTPYDDPSLTALSVDACNRPFEKFAHFCTQAKVPDHLYNDALKFFPYISHPRPPRRLPSSTFLPIDIPDDAKGLLMASAIDEALVEERPIIMHGVATRKMVTLIIGVGHSGKSTHAMGIGAAIALDVDYGPYRVREGCNVLIINRENDCTEQVLRLGAAVRQLGKTMKDLGDRLVLWPDSHDAGFLAVRDKGAVAAGPFAEKLKAKIKEHNIGVVVIDPLIDFANGVRENDNADQHAFSRIATRMATDLNCAIILVHHATKNAIPDYNQATRGASALPYASRLGLLLRPRRNGEVIIRHGKWTGTKQLPDTVWKFLPHECPGGLGMAMDVAEMSVWAWGHRDALLGMLRDDGPWPYALNGKDEEKRLDLMAAARFSVQPEQIRVYLKALEAEGMVKAVEGKVPRVPKGYRTTKIWAVVDAEAEEIEGNNQ